MLTWWGIMLDVVDTPYRGGVHYAYVVGHYAPPLYDVSTTSSIIPHHVSIIPRLRKAYPPHQA